MVDKCNKTYTSSYNSYCQITIQKYFEEYQQVFEKHHKFSVHHLLSV